MINTNVQFECPKGDAISWLTGRCVRNSGIDAGSPMGARGAPR